MNDCRVNFLEISVQGFNNFINSKFFKAKTKDEYIDFPFLVFLKGQFKL